MIGHRIKKWAIYALIDDRLSQRQRSNLFSHMSTCTKCRSFYEEKKKLTKQVAGLSVPTKEWTPIDHKITRFIAEVTPSKRTSTKRLIVSLSLPMLVIASGVLAFSLFQTAPKPTDSSLAPQRVPQPRPSHRASLLHENQMDMFPILTLDAGNILNEDAPILPETGEIDPIDIDSLKATTTQLKPDPAIRERAVRKWSGHLPMHTLRKALKPANHGIKRCYERALKRTPRLTATFQLSLTIDKSGHVTTKIKSSQLDSDLSECIQKQMSAIEFPPPKGGPMRLVIPFRLYPSS